MPGQQDKEDPPKGKRQTLVDASHHLLRAVDVLRAASGDALRDPVAVASVAAAATQTLHDALRSGDLKALKAIARVQVDEANKGGVLLVEADHLLSLSKQVKTAKGRKDDGTLVSSSVYDPEYAAQFLGKGMARAVQLAFDDGTPKMADHITERVQKAFAEQWQRNRALNVTPSSVVSWALEAFGWSEKQRNALLKFAVMRQKRSAK